MNTKYYLLIGDERKGPFTLDQLVDVGLERETLVWFKGCDDWALACDITELQGVVSELRRSHSRSQEDESFDVHERHPEAYLRGPYKATRNMHIVAIFLLFAGAALALYGSTLAGNEQAWTLLLAATCGGFALLALIVGWIFFLVFLYRCWSIIQDGETRVSPGTAAGYFFIPLFNFYWVFVGAGSLAKELNRYADRHHLAAPRASILLGMSFAGFFLASAVPFLGAAPALLNLFIIVLYMDSLFRTARCFCFENEKKAASPTDAPRPMVTPRAASAGLAALLLAVIGFPMFCVGAFFTPVKWTAHQDRIKLLEYRQDRLAKLEAIPRKDRGDQIGVEIASVRRDIRSAEQFDIPQGEKHLFGYTSAAVLGLCCCMAAIGFSIVARRSNAQLDSV